MDAQPVPRAAERLSPRDPMLTFNYSLVSLAEILLHNFEVAADWARRALAEHPNNARAHHRLACALGHLGDEAGARQAYEDSLKIVPVLTTAYIDATYQFTNMDDRALFIGGLRKAGWDGD